MGTPIATVVEAMMVVARDHDSGRRITKEVSSIMLIEEVADEGEDVGVVAGVKHLVVGDALVGVVAEAGVQHGRW